MMLPELLWLKDNSYSTICGNPTPISNSKHYSTIMNPLELPIILLGILINLTNYISTEALCVLWKVLSLKIEVKSNVSWRTIYVELTDSFVFEVTFSLVFVLPTDLNFSFDSLINSVVKCIEFYTIICNSKKKTKPKMNKQTTNYFWSSLWDCSNTAHSFFIHLHLYVSCVSFMYVRNMMVTVISAERGLFLLVLNWKLMDNSSIGFNITLWFIQI